MQHTDVTRSLLGAEATPAEAAALDDIQYTSNDVWLHTDQSLMPSRRAAWASWNCVVKEGGKGEGSDLVCCSYWVNLLQNLPPGAHRSRTRLEHGARPHASPSHPPTSSSRCAGAPDVFVTLNPPTPPKPDTVLKRFSLSHPLFTREALAAQAMLGGGALQGVGGIWYAGAWCGYGFHEDGIASAVKAVGGLCGGRSVTPWSPVSCAPKMTTRQKIFYSMFARFGARRALRRSSCAILAQFSDARSIPSRRRPPRPRRVDPRAVTDGRGAVPRRREGERARRVRAPRDECRYVREGDALALPAWLCMHPLHSTSPILPCLLILPARMTPHAPIPTQANLT